MERNPTSLVSLRRFIGTSGLTSQERAELALEFDRLRRLEQVIHRTKRTPKQGPRPRKLATRPQTDLVINGVRVCHLCKRPVPHKKGPDGKYHMLAVKRRWMQQVSHARYRERGWHTLWETSVRARYLRAIARRTAIFREIAPKSAAKMTPAEIESVIDKGRPGKTRWLNNIEKWKTWVRRRYA